MEEVSYICNCNKNLSKFFIIFHLLYLKHIIVLFKFYLIYIKQPEVAVVPFLELILQQEVLQAVGLVLDLEAYMVVQELKEVINLNELDQLSFNNIRRIVFIITIIHNN